MRDWRLPPPPLPVGTIRAPQAQWHQRPVVFCNSIVLFFFCFFKSHTNFNFKVTVFWAQLWCIPPWLCRRFQHVLEQRLPIVYTFQTPQTTPCRPAATGPCKPWTSWRSWCRDLGRALPSLAGLPVTTKWPQHAEHNHRLLCHRPARAIVCKPQWGIVPCSEWQNQLIERKLSR